MSNRQPTALSRLPVLAREPTRVAAGPAEVLASVCAGVVLEHLERPARQEVAA